MTRKTPAEILECLGSLPRLPSKLRAEIESNRPFITSASSRQQTNDADKIVGAILRRAIDSARWAPVELAAVLGEAESWR